MLFAARVGLEGGLRGEPSLIYVVFLVVRREGARVTRNGGPFFALFAVCRLSRLIARLPVPTQGGGLRGIWS